MSGPTVQVPVSLIRRALGNRYFPIAPLVKDEFLALLSQPTPTDKNGLATADELRPQGPHPKVTVLGRNEISLPLSIDEMTPGTSFRGHLKSFPTPTSLVLVAVGHMTVCKARSGEMYSALDVDPSTIRDVQPPKDSA